MVCDSDQPVLRLVKPIAGGIDVELIGDDVVAAATKAGIEFIRISGDSELFSLTNISRWDSNAGERKLALATGSGQAFILEGFPSRVAVRAKVEVLAGIVE